MKKSRTSPPPSSSWLTGKSIVQSSYCVCELHSWSSCCFHTLDSWWGNSTLQWAHLRQWMLRLPQSCSMALSPHHMISTTDQLSFPSPVISTFCLLEPSPSLFSHLTGYSFYLFIQLPSIPSQGMLHQEKAFSSLTHSWTLNLQDALVK